MLQPLRAALFSGIALLLAGCQGAIFATLNAATPNDHIEAREGIVFDAAHDLKADVYLPRVRAANAPVVVFFYGGTWRGGKRSWYRFIGERLAARGFITVVPDYRKYPEVRFPVFVTDAAHAVVWARDTFGSKDGRLFLAGHSAGAHIAALLGTDRRYLEAAGGSLDQVSGVVGYSGVYDFLPLTDDVLKDTFGPEDNWPDSQPVRFVDGDEPPFFLVHGRNDRLVWPRNSESLARELRANGVPVELLLRDHLGHYRSGLNLARTDADATTRALLEFLRSPPSRRQRDMQR